MSILRPLNLEFVQVPAVADSTYQLIHHQLNVRRQPVGHARHNPRVLLDLPERGNGLPYHVHHAPDRLGPAHHVPPHGVFPRACPAPKVEKLGAHFGQDRLGGLNQSVQPCLETCQTRKCSDGRRGPHHSTESINDSLHGLRYRCYSLWRFLFDALHEAPHDVGAYFGEHPRGRMDAEDVLNPLRELPHQFIHLGLQAMPCPLNTTLDRIDYVRTNIGQIQLFSRLPQARHQARDKLLAEADQPRHQMVNDEVPHCLQEFVQGRRHLLGCPAWPGNPINKSARKLCCLFDNLRHSSTNYPLQDFT